MNTLRTILIVLCVSGLACDERDSAELASEWRAAGLSVSEAETTDTDFGKACLRRDVNGVTVVQCKYSADSEAAEARAKGLAFVGKHTGAALNRGTDLLVVVDRDGADPQGRTINAVTKSFLGEAEPASKQAESSSLSSLLPKLGKTTDDESK